MHLTLFSLLLPVASSLVSLSTTPPQGILGTPSFCDLFNVVETPNKRGATVLEAPVTQKGVKLYIAIDSDSFQQQKRPGNGGIRLLNYKSTEDAIDDAVRLCKGMTRKHDMFRTGFSGAKVVVDSDHADLCEIEREALMKDAGKALEALEGQMYTGCDLNTSDEDMNYLVKATNDKFVLAGRNSRVDTNVATASSVIGSILGALHVMDETDFSKLTFTVQGCGKVGSVVAKELCARGAKVQTCDIFEEAAKIPGCNPIQDWANTPCDFLVPCANSLAITPEIAQNFPEGVRYCVGATNSPFACDEARSIFEKRGVMHVPESISSAGAILADSVEWYDIELYQTVEPSLMYGWIREQSQEKASNLVLKAEKESTKITSMLKDVVPSRSGDPVGKHFPEWIDLIKED